MRPVGASEAHCKSEKLIGRSIERARHRRVRVATLGHGRVRCVQDSRGSLLMSVGKMEY